MGETPLASFDGSATINEGPPPEGSGLENSFSALSRAYSRSELDSGLLWLVGLNILQKSRGWYEEEVPGDRVAEIQQSVIVAWRLAYEHVLEHLFDGAG